MNIVREEYAYGYWVDRELLEKFTTEVCFKILKQAYLSLVDS